MHPITYAAPLAGLLALGFAYWKAQWVNAQPAGSECSQLGLTSRWPPPLSTIPTG